MYSNGFFFKRYISYPNPFLSPSNDQQQQQQQLLSSFYYQQSPPSAQQMVNSRLPPPPPFANHLYLNSPSSPHAQYPLTQQQQQQNGPLPTAASNLFNDRYERTDGYLPFSNNSSYLSAMRFSPNPGYRTTKSGKQQIGPENSNLFICHLPQETNDQSLMSLFSQFGKSWNFSLFFSIFFLLFSRQCSVGKGKNEKFSFMLQELSDESLLGFRGQKNQSIEMFRFRFLR